jgi:hypothetical protein
MKTVSADGRWRCSEEWYQYMLCVTVCLVYEAQGAESFWRMTV